MKTFSIQPSETERSERVGCVLCGSDRAHDHWCCEGFTFVRCEQCGHIYQNPRPIFDDLKSRYQDEYFDYELENDAQFFDLMQRGLADIDFDRIEANTAKPRRFLDIGCATGMLVAHLASRGWEAAGTEICVPAAQFGAEQRGATIHVGTIEELSFPSRSFDLVHFSHVIEHVPDPRAFLREVARITRPGGHVVIVTPNTASFQAKRYGDHWRSAIADHLNLFSRGSLARLMQDCGFEVVRTKTWGGIAVGMAPPIIKKPADRLAKIFGFGDVVLQLGIRSTESGNSRSETS